MLHNNDFALDQLEERLEMFCINVPCIVICEKKVFWFTISYPCPKPKRICF